MLTKLIPVDDLPLKLGRKVPTEAEKAKSIALMEACAKVLDDQDADMKWVRDDRTPLSDFDHPAAEMDDPMAIVAAEFEKSASKYEKMFSSKHWIAVDPWVAHGGDMTAAARYSFKDGDIHRRVDHARREMYADHQPTNAEQYLLRKEAEDQRKRESISGITDIMRGVANDVADTANLTATGLRLLQQQAYDAQKMRDLEQMRAPAWLAR
jgi:hypothetical protein